MVSSNAPESRDPRYRILFCLARLKGIRLVTQTAVIEREYQAQGFTNLTTIPNPVYASPPRHFEPEYRSPFHLITVGRLIPQKSYGTLLDALNMLNSRQKDWRCTLVGDGPDRELLESQALTGGIRDKVTFFGWSDDVRTMLKKADAFIMTSLFEGQPNALLEAMSESIPCISTDFEGGAARALLGENQAGLIVPVGDVEGIAKAIEQLVLDSNLRKELGVRARQAVKPFEIDFVTDKWVNMLGLARNPRP